MKILYVTAFELDSDTSANIGNRAIIKGLYEKGCEISTVSRPLSQVSKTKNTVNDIPLVERYWLEYDKKEITKGNSKNIIKKIYDSIKYFIYKKIYLNFRIYDSSKKVVKEALKLKIDKRYDLIISASDLKISHLVAEALIKSNPNLANKWVQYWGDPFATDINRNSKLPRFIVEKEEYRILSKCDKIIYVSPFTLKNQQEKYKKLKDKMIFKPLAYSNEVIYPKVNNKVYTVGYFGDYKTQDRNIYPLYKAFKSMDSKLVIYGDSNIKLKEEENIIINQRVNLDELQKQEGKCDLLVCLCNKKGTQVPGKPSQCARTNKPILIILDGTIKEEMKNYFASYNRFYFCNNNTDSIKRTINRIKKNKKKFSPCRLLSGNFIAEEILSEIYKQ